jgi:antitoxin (DNA-binding transcriptional repressor) of toxin-antitoxin stability system
MWRISANLFFYLDTGSGRFSVARNGRKHYILRMKTISVTEMKTHWSQVESDVLEGATLLVMNHGRPAAQISPPGKMAAILEWEDHLSSAIPNRGESVVETLRADREGRW